MVSRTSTAGVADSEAPADTVNAPEPLRSRIGLEGGLEFEIYDFGGEGPVALLHHASGFCTGVWRRIARELRRGYRVIGFDARGHGDSSKPEQPYTWQVFGDDL